MILKIYGHNSQDKNFWSSGKKIPFSRMIKSKIKW